MTEATNMMPSPLQTQVQSVQSVQQQQQQQQQQQRTTEGESQGQTQIGQGGVQFRDLNIKQLSKELLDTNNSGLFIVSSSRNTKYIQYDKYGSNLTNIKY